MWRTAPVTAYEKLHRLHAEHSDVAMGPDGSLYMTNGNVNKLVGDRWIDIDPFAEGLMYDKKKDLFYSLTVKGQKANGKNIYGQMGRMKEPDRMSGIAHRLSVAPDGDFWVTTKIGRIYRGGPKNWNRQEAYGHDVVTGPGGQAVAMTKAPIFQAHKDWLKQHPNPVYYDGAAWHDLNNLPGDATSFAFDSGGNLWLLTMPPTPEPRSGSIYQRQGSSWKLMPEVPNARFIDRAPDGGIYVLAYTQELDKAKNRWIFDHGRFHFWQGDHWKEKSEWPDLTKRMRIGAFYHGSLIHFQDQLVWAHQTKWLTVKDVAVKTKKPVAEPEPIASLGEAEEDDGPGALRDLFQTTATPQVTETSAAFVGCWDWSNGVHVKVFADGRVDIGIFKAKWEQGASPNQFTVKWPSIYDYMNAQPGGKTYTGESSLKRPLSMTREQSTGDGPVGIWKRPDGIRLELKADGTVDAGVFQGFWKQKGKDKLILEWPVVDAVTIAADGNSLATKTQFEANTAVRSKQCHN